MTSFLLFSVFGVACKKNTSVESSVSNLVVEERAVSTAVKTDGVPRAPVQIIPGVGVGELRLGSSYEEVVSIMNGAPTKEQNYEDTKQEYIALQYDLSQYPIFTIGFDLELTYSNDGLLPPYPAYVLYFNNDELVAFVLTSYVYGVDSVSFLSTTSDVENVSIQFGDPVEKIQNNLFSEYLHQHTDTDNVTEHQYLDKGISFGVDEGVVRAIELFRPLTQQEITQFMQ